MEQGGSKSCLEKCLNTAIAGRVCVLAMSQTRLLAGLLGECHDSALAQLCGKQNKSNMPNAPFRKYQTSGFAFEAYSFAIHNAEKGVLTTLNNTQLNLNFIVLSYSGYTNRESSML